MSKYIKQLTRENTLLDRSLRMVAYAQSLRELGRAKIAKSPVVGHGLVTSLFYEPIDYKKQQQIIYNELRNGRIDNFSMKVIKYLEQAYVWAKSYQGKKLSPVELEDYLHNFLLHHAHARGTVAYGYWGEPIVVSKLRSLLKNKHHLNNIDDVVSILSVPHNVHGILTALHSTSPSLANRRLRHIKKIKLNKADKELVDLLSWFTLFYEIGERVAMYLYDELINHLGRTFSKTVLDNLIWYDVESLQKFFHGYRLSQIELRRRRECYVLFLERKLPKVLSGNKAKWYINKYLEITTPVKSNKIFGTIANRGFAVGQVKIVITQAEQAKVKRGDIVISTMTTPRLMTAVRRAGAIVTDEGGMTAHAAIISRELNIPCIVGTKIATKVFKDGDKVIVDANQGVVTRLR